FQPDARSQPGPITTHRGNIDCLPSLTSPLNCLIQQTHPPPTVEKREQHSPGTGAPLVTSLDFADPLELVETRLQAFTVRHIGQIEHPGAQCPGAPVTLGCEPYRITPRVR